MLCGYNDSPLPVRSVVGAEGALAVSQILFNLQPAQLPLQVPLA